MPIYDLIVLSIPDPDMVDEQQLVCPRCGTVMQRMPQRVAIRFNGKWDKTGGY